ncbi:hypothetical protein AB0469_33650 [Streptomyces sp. NPDC093801]|uniref:hypothetical protein n=1 Tax=Streptomyces sp. NPDC093801 TaxID=3155203 RepID=UPI00344C980A
MDLKLHLTVHEARSGRESFRVVRPARTPAHAELFDDPWWLNAYVDRDAALLMAGLWTLAAGSPRSLVHLPLRGPTPPAGSGRLDLVLLHHSLHVAPSHWKGLRGRLSPGRPRTVDLRLAEPAEEDHASLHHAENRDRFHQSVHAETLFMTGSARTFRQGAAVFLDVARNGPGHTVAYPDLAYRHRHYCRNVPCDARFRDIHVEYREPPAPEEDPARA